MQGRGGAARPALQSRSCLTKTAGFVSSAEDRCKAKPFTSFLFWCTCVRNCVAVGALDAVVGSSFDSNVCGVSVDRAGPRHCLATRLLLLWYSCVPIGSSIHAACVVYFIPMTAPYSAPFRFPLSNALWGCCTKFNNFNGMARRRGQRTTSTA